MARILRLLLATVVATSLQASGSSGARAGVALAVPGHANATPSIAADDIREPHKAIFYTSTRDGGTFPPRTRVSPEGRYAAHPQVAIDAAGRPFVVWDELDEGRRRVFGARGVPGGRFGEPVALSTADSASYPVVARSGASLLVAWTEGASSASVIRIQEVRADE